MTNTTSELLTFAQAAARLTWTLLDVRRMVRTEQRTVVEFPRPATASQPKWSSPRVVCVRAERWLGRWLRVRSKRALR